MPAASPAHARHCSCPRLPDRAALIDLYSGVGLTRHASAALADLLLGSPPAPPTRLHDRSLAHVSSPDDWGHIRWTGPRSPTGGIPRVTVDGRRMPVTLWLWLRSGRPDIEGIVRTCHDVQCIAPGHHALPTDDPVAEVALQHAALAAFDRAHPRINPRPKSWDTSDLRGEKCKLFGHPLKIYGDPRLRRAYCRACAALERQRVRNRTALEHQIDRAVYRLSPEQVTYAPEPEQTAPTLAEQVEALQAAEDARDAETQTD